MFLEQLALAWNSDGFREMTSVHSSACSLMDYAGEQALRIRSPSSQAPQLLVVIDTEEEFDWSAPPSPEERAVTAIDHIDRVQSIFDRYGISPCYVVDHPVVAEPVSANRLREIMEDGRCEIGAHLHPWVNPPINEKHVARSHMYPGNLDESTERGKLEVLTEAIEENFGRRPRVYKAGRYGFGPNTLEILKDLGYNIDLSFCPPLDSTGDGGPDYSHCHADPFWFRGGEVLGIPVTGAFTGVCGRLSPSLYRLSSILKPLKVPAILSRLGVLDRLTLSPEGFDAGEHKKVTEYLLNQGVRVFTWSFHSTSVKPGCAPYVGSDEELNSFLATFEQYFEYFFGELGGVATTPSGLRLELESKE